MKRLFGSAAIAAIVAITLPAWAETAPAPSPTARPTAGLGHNSHAGERGLPGGKSGPTVTPSGSTAPEPQRPSGDQKGVSGLPGSKSGPTTSSPPSAAGK